MRYVAILALTLAQAAAQAPLSARADAIEQLITRHYIDVTIGTLKGLLRLARVSGIPGFLARGIYPDGKRYDGDPSTLDYSVFHYAIWRYYNSPLAGAAERGEMRAVVAANLNRLEEYRFIITNEADDPTSLHELASPGPMAGEHLRAILLSGSQITEDPHWRDVYNRRLPARLSHLRFYGWAQPTPHPTTCPRNAWTMDRGVLSFRILLDLEKDEERPFGTQPRASPSPCSRRVRRNAPNPRSSVASCSKPWISRNSATSARW